MQPVVVALGGNAFVAPGRPLTMAAQLEFAHRAMQQLLPLLRSNVPLVISHGNGPQVGQMLLRVEKTLGQAYALPLEVCVAETEGELGYVLAQALHNVLADCGLSRPIASLLTQVVVDTRDPAFTKPTKPIGVFYDAEQAASLEAAGFQMLEDAGRGYRRVVPSPLPQDILEIPVIQQLLDFGTIVVAAGGGGIPVAKQDHHWHGIEAVIDKDLTAALLAERIDAQRLVILTDVPCAYRHFRSTRQEPIGRVTPRQLERDIADGHFAEGSMLPKIEAAMRFTSAPGRIAYITNAESLAEAWTGKAGTRVEPSFDDNGN
ncbi:MAG: Carbamate kinase 1 [Planctomycetota bacterium]